MTLSPEHLKALHASAISDEVIQARGYRTITDPAELSQLDFAPSQCRVPGLLLPVWTTDGSKSLYVFRPDNPRVVENRTKRNPDGTYPNKVIKYEMPKAAGVRLDCPPPCLPKLADPTVPLWITEGQKKADALASAGLCAIALLGVWNYKGKNEFGASTFLVDWDYIALKGREIRIVFDSDVMVKRPVQQALARLTEHLQRKGATVTAIYLPHGKDSAKVGVDDWLAEGHTRAELEKLVDAPRPLPQPAPPTVELLDGAPAMLSRPLTLVDGRAYAAAWLYTKVTKRESRSKSGEIIRHEPPHVTTERRLFIIRDDGTVFGDGGHKSIEEAGLDVHLPEIPPDEKLWTAQGVMSYSNKYRPEPACVFQRIVEVVNRFIDFDRSLTDQNTMAEAITCYILSTWFLDAFNVVGFLWPNGERGSGKTHLLIVITELAYLGQLILAGGTFACLRDLADYGATLAFDDAECLSDPKKTDPDKRALLLAGNRRGVTVPLKEQGPDKNWHTRYVNAFCPRLFSAIRLPDPILASRTIIIPLIRTADRERANTDPHDYAAWPTDHRKLLDDLWALSLANLSKLPEYDTRVGLNARLAGRNLQPWRGVLSVAAWLDNNGMPGLWQRMESLSMDYQKERPDFEVSDLTVLVIRALIQLAVRDISDISAVSDVNRESLSLHFETSMVTDTAVKIAQNEELDIDPESITSRRVGRVLGKMRLKKEREAGKGTRRWALTLKDLRRWALSYAIPMSDDDVNIATIPIQLNVTDGLNVANVTPLQTALPFPPVPVEVDPLLDGVI
jgi:hypothetical protein